MEQGELSFQFMPPALFIGFLLSLIEIGIELIKISFFLFYCFITVLLLNAGMFV